MIAVYIISAAVFILFLIVFVRALLFVPKDSYRREAPSESVDAESAMNTLSEMIKLKTVSNPNRSLENKDEFEGFRALLPTLFPAVYEKCIYEEPSDRSVLLRWKGQTDGNPTVLMAHYDVVDATEEEWDKPAFEGLIENGVLWGRGALDTKVTLNAILCAAEALIKDGYVPKNDVYFAFGGDEEINGYGAKTIAELLRKRGVKPAMVLDEGGAVVNNVFPGVEKPCALIGVAEKGMVNIEYTVRCIGGHSSAPTPDMPLEKLSRACLRASNRPFKFTLTPPVREMMSALSRHSAFVYKLVFANLWLFSPLLNVITKRRGGELSAIVRTTTAFTQIQGSPAMNVIAPIARMVSNHRIIPGETVDSVHSQIKKTVKDSSIEIKIKSGMNPSPVSEIYSDAFNKIAYAASDTWHDVIVSPYLMLASSDSRHYSEFSDKVYRFSPLCLTDEERGSIHGNNERISLSQVSGSVEFYLRLIKEL